LAERLRVRALYEALASACDGCITLTATGAAPVGLQSTGKPIFAVPFSFLGVPALSLPLLKEQNLPLGLQITGFANRDAAAFSVAGFVMQALGGVVA
jgi:Asp-tRNA(Asn)/Glu-tRNA(Gln) amidotransferase A subunit family amidase